MVSWISRPEARRRAGTPARVRVLAERLGVEIDVAASREGVGDHQGREARKFIFTSAWTPPLEVPVAGQRGADDEIPLPDRGADLLGQGAGVADAGRAPEPDDVEAEGFEVFEQPRLPEVVPDHHRAGGEARLHPGLHHEAALARIACEQAGPHQHRRVRRVGARGDRRDHHRAVAECVARAVLLDGDPRDVVSAIPASTPAALTPAVAAGPASIAAAAVSSVSPVPAPARTPAAAIASPASALVLHCPEMAGDDRLRLA